MTLGLCPGDLMVHSVYIFWWAEEMMIMLHFEGLSQRNLVGWAEETMWVEVED